MSEKVNWVVFREEESRRGWVEMPKNYLGTPLFEHATDYITELSDGSRVMVRKKDGYIFENVSFEKKATEEDIARMRSNASKKYKEKMKRGGIVIY